MANIQDINKNLAQVKKAPSLQSLIEKSSKALGAALPSHLNPERLVRIAQTSIRLNPELLECTPESFLGSLFVLAQVGLEPIAGRAYLLPFRNKRKVGNSWQVIKEVQAVIGYKGLIDLFYRHESALSIDMQTVHGNDTFDYQYGTDSFIKHKPSIKNRGEVIGYYAVAKMKGGASIFRFMSKEDAIAHGQKHSKSFNVKENKFSEYSPWHKELDTMCMKTVLIQLSKLLPLSVELQRAIQIDETSRDFKEGIDNALDIKPTTNFDETPEPEIVEQPKEEKEV